MRIVLTFPDTSIGLRMMPELHRVLSRIGLGDKEIRMLSALLENGPMYAAALAKAARINRTTAYGVLKELSERGLVSSSERSGILLYESIAPEMLPSYIERRREELAETKREFESVIPQIKLLRKNTRILPKVRYFEGEEGLKQAYEDTLENNTEKKLRDITGVDAVYRRLGEKWVNYYLQKRTRLGIACVDLAPETDWARESRRHDKKYMRTTKFIPRQYAFDAEIGVYDNTVGIFSYAQEAPIAVIIEDATIADAMKKIFDLLESSAK